MSRARWVSLSCLLFAGLACGGNNQSNYVKAAIGAGAMIAGAGVNRAVTKGCWGTCSRGYACNEKSGLCELGECLPGCEVGTHCVRDAREISYCARDSGSSSSSAATTTAAPAR